MAEPPDNDARLHLLLATAHDLRPALEEGWPLEAAYDAPKPHDLSRVRAPESDGGDFDRNDLAAYGWGVIAPEGPQGDAMLEAIAPLIRLREGEQNARVRIDRIRGAMDAEEAARWANIYYGDDAVIIGRPTTYLLLLGDLHQISLEVQQALAPTCFVGRLCFSDHDGNPILEQYAAYARKVVELSQRPASDTRPDLLCYVPDDGTAATAAARAHIVEPCFQQALRAKARVRFSIDNIRLAGGRDASALLDAAAQARPTLLLSAAHGVGSPRETYYRDLLWRERQGALSMGEDELEAETVEHRRFLPGGVWLSLASFSAAVPVSSPFRSWVRTLAGKQSSIDFMHHDPRMEAALDSFVGLGERPFVTRLPQAALANPQGPLAVIGQTDLAWIPADGDAGTAPDPVNGLFSTLRLIARGDRVGVAFSRLTHDYQEANARLRASYEAEERAREPLIPAERARRALLWMLRNDLRGYVLLGDPAVRLPLAGTAVLKEPAPPSPDVAPVPEAAPIPDVAPPAETAPAPDAPSDETIEVPLNPDLRPLVPILAGRPFSLVLGDLIDEERALRDRIAKTLAIDLESAGDPARRDLPLHALAERFAIHFGRPVRDPRLTLDGRLQSALQRAVDRGRPRSPAILDALARRLQPGVHISLLFQPLLEQAVARAHPDRTVYSLVINDSPVLRSKIVGINVARRQANGGDDWQWVRETKWSREVRELSEVEDIIILRPCEGLLAASRLFAPLLLEDHYIDRYMGDRGSGFHDPEIWPILSLLERRPALFLGMSLFNRHHRILLRWLYGREPIPADSIALLDPGADPAEAKVWTRWQGFPRAGAVHTVTASPDELAAALSPDTPDRPKAP